MIFYSNIIGVTSLYLIIPPILYILMNERSFTKDIIALNCLSTVFFSNMFWKDYDKSSIWFKLDVTSALLLAINFRFNYTIYILLYSISDINLKNGRLLSSLIFYLLFRHLVFLDITSTINVINPFSSTKSALIYHLNWIILYLVDTTYKKGFYTTSLFITFGIPLIIKNNYDTTVIQ